MLTQSFADQLSNLVLNFFNDSFIYITLVKFHLNFKALSLTTKFEDMERVEMRQMQIPVLLLCT